MTEFDVNNCWPQRSALQGLVLLAITAVLIVLCLMLTLPFLSGLTWAASLAIATFPLHRAIENRIVRPGLSAGISVVLIAFLIVGPVIVLARSTAGEVQKGAGQLRAYVESDKPAPSEEPDSEISRLLELASPYFDVKGTAQRAVDAAAAYVPLVVAGSIATAVQLFITFFVLFFLFRDRKAVINQIKRLLPLSQSEGDKLVHRISETIKATIHGTFGVSLIQGTLGGLIFWWLGLPAPALWGAVMFLLSLIPVLGAPIVWIPVALVLALTGEWGKAAILTIWSVVVIGSIDNILYPIFVGDRVRMHTLVVFFSAVGGIATIGAAGLVLGPVIVVATNALIDFWKERTAINPV